MFSCKIVIATFWERAANSVDRMFSLYLTVCIFSYLLFDFEGGIWVLMAPVPGHYILVTFSGKDRSILHVGFFT